MVRLEYHVTGSMRIATRTRTKALGTRYINFKSVHLPYDASSSEISAVRNEVAAAGLEYEINSDDPMPGMKQSFAYMRGVLAGIVSGNRKPSRQAKPDRMLRRK